MLAAILWYVRGLDWRNSSEHIHVYNHKESKLPLYADKLQSDVHVHVHVCLYMKYTSYDHVYLYNEKH